MADTLEALKTQTRGLTPAERVDLAAYLLGSVDPATGDDPAWRAEVARRVADIRSGTVAGRSLDTVIAELEGRTR